MEFWLCCSFAKRVLQGRHAQQSACPLQDANLTLAFGRRYGLVGRNGTGKTTLLRAMAQHQIKGIPPQCQILHVEQEVRSGCIDVVSPLSARHA